MSVRVAAPAASVPRRRQARSLRPAFRRDWVPAWMFLPPALVVMIGLIAYPFVSAILLSFQNKLVGTPGIWVGFKNYEDLLVGKDLSAQFLQSVRVSFIFTAAAIAMKFVLGLG